MTEQQQDPAEVVESAAAPPGAPAQEPPPGVGSTDDMSGERPASSDPEQMDGDLGAHGADGVGGGES